MYSHLVSFSYDPMGAAFAARGFGLALERIGGDDPENDHIAIGEPLFWGITLDELLYTKYDGKKPGPYALARDADLNGGAVNGARLARNAITHGAVVTRAREYQGGLSFPVTFPAKFGIPVWKTLPELLKVWTPDEQKYLPSQKASYANHFASMPTKPPVAKLQAWLATAAQHGFVL